MHTKKKSAPIVATVRKYKSMSRRQKKVQGTCSAGDILKDLCRCQKIVGRSLRHWNMKKAILKRGDSIHEKA